MESNSPSDTPPRAVHPFRLYFGCGLALLVFPFVLLFLVALIAPSTWESRASQRVAASPAEVHAYLEDPRHWESWFRPGAGDGPLPVTYTFEGSERGDGAVIRWRSEVESIGNGTITIRASDPPRSLGYEVAMDERAVTAEGTIELAVVDGGTMVTIVDRGTLPFPGGLYAWIVARGVEQRLGENLSSLKRVFARGEAGSPAGD